MSNASPSSFPVIVVKFGGASVADGARLAQAAAHIMRHRRQGKRVAAVISAMGEETDRLQRLIDAIAERGGADFTPPAAECDVILSCGEQISAGLLAVALAAEGVEARSFQGWQAGIATDGRHRSARILAIDPAPVLDVLSGGGTAIVAGFQGISATGRIATLGRGGSDLSAVALAVALGAESCEIYTDVDGVHTADPRLVETTRTLRVVSYEEMLEMASLGARVLQTRAVELAMIENVRLRVRPSFIAPDHPDIDDVGTLVTHESKDMERETITAVAHDDNQAKITLTAVPDAPGLAGRLFAPLAEAGVNVDMIVQNIGRDGATDMTFTVPASEWPRLRPLLRRLQGEIGAGELIVDDRCAKVSAIGVGMRSRSGIAARMFAALGEAGVNIQAISTSEIKISVLIDRDCAEAAVRLLHDAYGLADPRGQSRPMKTTPR